MDERATRAGDTSVLGAERSAGACDAKNVGSPECLTARSGVHGQHFPGEASHDVVAGREQVATRGVHGGDPSVRADQHRPGVHLRHRLLELRALDGIVGFGQGTQFVVDARERDQGGLGWETGLDVAVLGGPVGEAHHLKHPQPDLWFGRFVRPQAKGHKLIREDRVEHVDVKARRRGLGCRDTPRVRNCVELVSVIAPRHRRPT